MNNPEEKKTTNEIEKNLEELNYPAGEDIYNNEDKMENIDPDNITTENIIDQKDGEWNENTFDIDEKDKMGDDLDVPGSELDDQQENIGSEDEENNFYSQGDN